MTSPAARSAPRPALPPAGEREGSGVTNATSGAGSRPAGPRPYIERGNTA